MLASAVASSTKECAFICITASGLESRFVGGSEKLVTASKVLVRTASYCICNQLIGLLIMYVGIGEIFPKQNVEFVEVRKILDVGQARQNIQLTDLIRWKLERPLQDTNAQNIIFYYIILI